MPRKKSDIIDVLVQRRNKLQFDHNFDKEGGWNQVVGHAPPRQRGYGHYAFLKNLIDDVDAGISMRRFSLNGLVETIKRRGNIGSFTAGQEPYVDAGYRAEALELLALFPA